MRRLQFVLFLSFAWTSLAADVQSELLQRLNENQGVFSLYNCDVELQLNKTPEGCVEGVDCKLNLMLYVRDVLRGNEIEFSHVFDQTEVNSSNKSIKSFAINHNWFVDELRSYQHFEMKLDDDFELVAIELAEGVVPVNSIRRRVRCSSNPY